MFLKNENITFKIRRSKVTDYAALSKQILLFPKFTSYTNIFIKLKMQTDENVGPSLMGVPTNFLAELRQNVSNHFNVSSTNVDLPSSKYGCR